MPNNNKSFNVSFDISTGRKKILIHSYSKLYEFRLTPEVLDMSVKAFIDKMQVVLKNGQN